MRNQKSMNWGLNTEGEAVSYSAKVNHKA